MRWKINENTSIRAKVFFIYLPLQLALLLGFGMLVNVIYRELTEQWLEEELSLKAGYAVEAVDDMMLKACSVVNRCYMDVNPSILNRGGSLLGVIVSDEEMAPVETFELYIDVLNPYFAAYYESGKRILRLYLPDGYLMHDGRYVMRLDTLSGIGDLSEYDPAKIHWQIDGKNQVIRLFRVLVTEDGRHIGALSYEINFTVVARLLSSYLDTDTVAYAYDLSDGRESARIVDRSRADTAKTHVFAATYQQGRLYAAYHTMPFRKVDQQLTRILWLLIVVALFMSGLLSALFSRMITGRMFRLTRRIRLLRDGHSAEGALTGTDEMAMLDKYITELANELDLRNRREQTILLENKNLEIQMLQLQFKPHFLYNTLSAIRWSVLKTDNRMVAKVIEDMIAMYRMTLNNGESMIPVEKEIHIVRCYLDITAFAYDTQYEWILNVDPAMLPLEMPKCVLQPLVENAVKYAYDPGDKYRRIALNGRVDAGGMTFEVRDYGKGFSEEVLAWARAEADAPPPAGIGLSNLRNRMRSIFAGKARFSIANAESGGALIRISFPVIHKED